MSKTRQERDVIIVGAGIAGSALALALAKCGKKVMLIDPGELQLDWPSNSGKQCQDFDHRVSALGAASRTFLETNAAWPGTFEQRVARFETMRVWDGEGMGRISFDSAESNEEALGYLVENRLIITALHRAIDALDTLNYMRATVIALGTGDGQKRSLITEENLSVQAPLIVAADGTQSALREMAGFKCSTKNYEQMAIVATVRCEQTHQNTAWQRFMNSGPLAFLPLADPDDSGEFCSIVWSADTPVAEELMRLDDTAFTRQLGQAFEFRLGKILDCGKRYSFPLRERHAFTYVRNQVALIGDAAHTIHPLAGQGANLGLLDAQALAEELSECATKEALRRYQWRRVPHNWISSKTMTGFKHLFANQLPAITLARRLGMAAVNNNPWLKSRLIKLATRGPSK